MCRKRQECSPIYINQMSNLILRANRPREKGLSSAFRITTINHPMNKTNNTLSTEFILRLCNVSAYAEGENFFAVISLFLMYDWTIIPVMYPFTFRFAELSNAYIFLIVIILFDGITCMYTAFFLEIFKIFSNYCPGRGLIDIAYNVS